MSHFADSIGRTNFKINDVAGKLIMQCTMGVTIDFLFAKIGEPTIE